MTNTIKSERKGIYIEVGNQEIWEIKSTKHLLKFWNWIQKKKLMPGDIIPKKIFRKYYKRSEKK